MVYGNAHFGPGSGVIWIQSVGCSGNEIDFSSCLGNNVYKYYVAQKYYTHSFWGYHTHYRQLTLYKSPHEWGHHQCGHDSDVSITCSKYILNFGKNTNLCLNICNVLTVNNLIIQKIYWI